LEQNLLHPLDAVDILEKPCCLPGFARRPDCLMQRFIASLLVPALIASLAAGHAAVRLASETLAVQADGEVALPPLKVPSQHHDLRTSTDADGTVLSRTGSRCRVLSRDESARIKFCRLAEASPHEVDLHGPFQDLNVKDFPTFLAHFRLRI
jgi:hypothetical protein